MESSIQRLIHEKNKIDSSNQSSEELTAQILQNIDFKQAEDLLKANQLQQLKSDESSEPMVVVDLNENTKKDILFHAKFLLKVSVKLHSNLCPPELKSFIFFLIISKFAPKSQYCYTFLNQSIPLVTVT